MEIQFYGANCVRLTTKKATIVIDDNEATVAKAGDIALFTGVHNAPKADVKIVIEQPGEYEVSDTSVQGIAARSHMDEPGQQSTTMFKIIGEDVRVAVLGHVYPELNDVQLEALGTIDVLILPVGGSGYTLDAVGALKVIKKIEPKIIIPTHYADKAIKYEVPQASLEDVLKELSMEPKETVPKLKLKGGELLGESNQLIILERQ
ncbi:MAG TPA: MBL fold metallo-hydrolase [Candidatus Saccharimonadales bacterium]|nr:MBL fold metallo-hydrolase [Candidatus Saccharimonadales bacterium]